MEACRRFPGRTNSRIITSKAARFIDSEAPLPQRRPSCPVQMDQELKFNSEFGNVEVASLLDYVLYLDKKEFARLPNVNL